MAQACFVVQAGNLSDSPAGSLAIVQASTVQVVNSFSTNMLSNTRAAALDGATLLPYWNAEGWRANLFPGNPFWIDYAARFPQSVACYASGITIPAYGYRAIRPDATTGTLHAHVICDLSAGWDGVYLDQSWRQANANVALLGPLYAGGGAEFLLHWLEYLEAMANVFRARNVLCVSNCGGDPLHDRNATLRGVGFDAFTCESAVAIGTQVQTFLQARRPHLNVSWFSSPGVDIPGLCHDGVLIPT